MTEFGTESPRGEAGSRDAAQAVAAREPARIFDVGKRSRDELATLGRAMRQDHSWQSHRGWKPDPQRPDPVEILRSQEQGRVEELIPIRYGRMLRSPFAFYRGAAAVMAWDLSRTPTMGVSVQACGDAHADNFGVYGSPERRVVFDINDFDETLPAPWEYDVKRLAASVLLSARNEGRSDRDGLDAVRATVRSYCTVIDALSRETTLDIHYAHVEATRLIEQTADPDVVRAIKDHVQGAQKRTSLQAFKKWVRITDGQLRFVEDPPLIVRLPDETIERFHVLFNEYRGTLQSNRRHLLEQYRFRDAARKVVGVGSVGLRAYVVLLEGRGELDPLMIQVKESVSSVLSPYLGRSGFASHGQRVVEGQRLMQAISDPFLGWAPFDERDVYVRQLRDMKGLTATASSLAIFESGVVLRGGTLARAHARSVDPALLRGYLGKGETFAETITDFALAYADQSEGDYERLSRAVKTGDLPAVEM